MTEHEADIDLPIEYLPDDEGFRWLTIDSPTADMTGWRVEVGDDAPWLVFRSMKPDVSYREVRDFQRVSFSVIGERWSAPVNWGELVVRWMPPDAVEQSA
ncbi:hypothetical protein [Mycolicibacterium arseniciresistens]|uniref:Uncharacterized protein n=1 Tax=Mycolicibacterium arseniciresistens TaxID=3062257 RepID=A0ABT8UN42_9MYCO|nr:hypothetical protein [Mycolicibacterium arseniciresistens]MDO3639228.1 hypothetical protein [Mycolicibacterium arseniciresistens]